MANEAPKPKRQFGGELVIPVIAVIFTLYYFSTIWNSPWTAQVSAFFVGGVLLLVCGLFLARVVLSMRRGEGALGFANLFNHGDFSTGRIWLIAATVGYCVLIDYGGFTLTTFLFLAFSMGVLGGWRKLGLIAGLSAAMALGGWAVFIWAFDTRFPRGPFEDLMRAVLANG